MNLPTEAFLLNEETIWDIAKKMAKNNKEGSISINGITIKWKINNGTN